MDKMNCLEFVPHTSLVMPSFWSKLTEVKLDIDKLDETNRTIWGYISNLTSDACPVSILEVDSTSFNTELNCQQLHTLAYGRLLNKNTIEQFKDCDKNKLLDEEGRRFWDVIVKGGAIENPSLLNVFFILSFADLKKYHYYYWFAFPVPANLYIKHLSTTAISDQFDSLQLERLHEQYMKLDVLQRAYFVIKQTANGLEVDTLKSHHSLNDTTESFYFAFTDASTTQHPGWPLRNYTAFILLTWPQLSGKPVQFVSYRLGRDGSKITCQKSVLLKVQMPDCDGDVEKIIYKDPNCAWLGWEKNERGKLGPKLANMKNTLDPKSLAESAVDLNLKLMKWRLLPDINLDKIKNTKCLLLGSGTLGCSVARTLLGWGVRQITFVDNSTVSFSNPVRQSLFTYENCLKNSPKSIAAAESLKNIFPGVVSKGVQLSIPMPGHQIGDSLLQQTKESVDSLQRLIEENDVIFLLTDSRESRWLPTLLGAVCNKIVINAALGFDTYLVLRHGANSSNGDIEEITDSSNGFKIIPGSQLGCYFCNDVTAPGNSLKDRSLDQQCTVTRPGISAIAGALAVELAVSLLQHEDGARAPAYYTHNYTGGFELDTRDECCLGIIPHSVRGFLSTFSHVVPATQRFKHCVACSDAVINEYKSRGFEFLLQVFNSSKYLEDLTGMSEKYKETEQIEILELSDEDGSF